MRYNSFIYRVLRRAYWEVCRLLPINPRKVFFSSYYGRGYSDNVKYIADELRGKGYELIWMVNSSEAVASLPQEIKPCQVLSFDWVYQLSTAAVWIDNCRKVYVHKKPKQFYLQTYHGSICTKKVEHDVADKLSPEYVKMSIKDAKDTDLMLSGDHYTTIKYHSSFWYSGPVAELGYPRYDILLAKNHIQIKRKVDAFFKKEPNTQYILYAPTFRNDYNFKVYDMDYKGVLSECRKKFGKNYVLLVHLHPNVASRFSELVYDDEIINATSYPDMQELLAISDILIGDYSSVNVDFSLTGRPIFRFATDIEDYKKDRDFYLRIDEYPFPLAETNNELLQAIRMFDLDKYARELAEFHKRIGFVFNDHSSKDVAKIIEDYIKIKDKKQLMEKYKSILK